VTAGGAESGRSVDRLGGDMTSTGMSIQVSGDFDESHMAPGSMSFYIGFELFGFDMSAGGVEILGNGFGRGNCEMDIYGWGFG